MIYKICGWVNDSMRCNFRIIFFNDSFKALFGNIPIMFILEAIGVEDFAISWLTKGETFWPDVEHYIKKA